MNEYLPYAIVGVATLLVVLICFIIISEHKAKNKKQREIITVNEKIDLNEATEVLNKDSIRNMTNLSTNEDFVITKSISLAYGDEIIS